MTYPSTFSRLTVTKENLATDEGRRLETFQLGIWKVSILKRTQLNLGKRFLGLKEEFGYFRRLAIDVYTLEPMLATLFILNELLYYYDRIFTPCYALCASSLEQIFTSRRHALWSNQIFILSACAAVYYL